MNFTYKISLFNILAPLLFIFMLYMTYRTVGDSVPGIFTIFGIFIPILLLIIDIRLQYIIKNKMTILFLEILLSIIGGLLGYLYLSFLNFLN